MVVHLEVTDRGGFRELTVDRNSFWVGAQKSSCDVELDLPGCAGRVMEVKLEQEGGLRVRAENGLPFPVRSVTGTVGRRFESVLDGDVLNVGPALVKIRAVPVAAGLKLGEELDPSTLPGGDAGAPVGSWYGTFMEVADTLEGVTEPERMISTALEATLSSTGADRVYLQLDDGNNNSNSNGDDDEASRLFYLSHTGDRIAFRVSRTLVEQAREGGRVVHVPIASADPVASRFSSVRREGISSSIAIPMQALGKTLGVLYADCVRDGAVLTASDLQRVAFIARMLAGALGNRTLVASLVRSVPDSTSDHSALQTTAPACAEFVERVKLYAPTDYTVLVRGETGTGKEVIATALHELSRRSKGPFVPVNCAAIPEPLMESMLFGHEKGAFTGATQTSSGHFDEADGGTILLDEVGDMALDLQAKILRVLQDRLVSPVGSRRQHKVDVRVIAATHQDLERMVEEGRFREDLYYRLRELEITLPALRDRTEDILLLCSRFLGAAAKDLGYEEVPELTTETLDFLQRCPWRGNIRELRHVRQRRGVAGRWVGRSRCEHLDIGPSTTGSCTEPEEDIGESRAR